jgi:hypothetical protein
LLKCPTDTACWYTHSPRYINPASWSEVVGSWEGVSSGGEMRVATPGRPLLRKCKRGNVYMHVGEKVMARGAQEQGVLGRSKPARH